MIIPLHGKHGQGKSAIVDDENYELIRHDKWYVTAKGYVIKDVTLNGVRTYDTMARVILRLDKSNTMQADHINRDKLDNRKQNLRIVTHAQNQHNVPKRKNKIVDCPRGVSWDKSKNKYRASVKLNRISYCLGVFDCKIEAGEASKAFRLNNMTHTVEI